MSNLRFLKSMGFSMYFWITKLKLRNLDYFSIVAAPFSVCYYTGVVVFTVLTYSIGVTFDMFSWSSVLAAVVFTAV